MSKNQLKIEVIFSPTKRFSKSELENLVNELRSLASTCFPETPNYQVLTGETKELERSILSLARDKNGKLLGFCSALILPIKDVGNVFHTGLTCVHPSARGLKLTHKLTSKLLTKYLLRQPLFSEVWLTNCACVLSSIGNIAKYFEEVYPSPTGPKYPSMTHINIANRISKSYREQIAINSTADFNINTFVFEGSVQDTLFSKNEEDTKFHHRDKKLNNYYKDLLDFERGDEVLQIGKVSLLTLPKYYLNQLGRKLKTSKVNSEGEYAHS